MPILRKKKSARQEREAAPVHGDVRDAGGPQEGQGQVPAGEGGAQVPEPEKALEAMTLRELSSIGPKPDLRRWDAARQEIKRRFGGEG